MTDWILDHIWSAAQTVSDLIVALLLVLVIWTAAMLIYKAGEIICDVVGEWTRKKR